MGGFVSVLPNQGYFQIDKALGVGYIFKPVTNNFKGLRNVKSVGL
jgi:hypothetical protein